VVVVKRVEIGVAAEEVVATEVAEVEVTVVVVVAEVEVTVEVPGVEG
jgi:hypothetical protein